MNIYWHVSLNVQCTDRDTQQIETRNAFAGRFVSTTSASNLLAGELRMWIEICSLFRRPESKRLDSFQLYRFTVYVRSNTE